MDNLTQKGLDYINAQKGMLATWAREQLENEVIPNLNQHGDDTWLTFSMKNNGNITSDTVLEDTIDVNIWNSADSPDVWRAAAYPLEVNSVGDIQTSTNEFIVLF